MDKKQKNYFGSHLGKMVPYEIIAQGKVEEYLTSKEKEEEATSKLRGLSDEFDTVLEKIYSNCNIKAQTYEDGNPHWLGALQIKELSDNLIEIASEISVQKHIKFNAIAEAKDILLLAQSMFEKEKRK